jgi:hypothetical protein
MKIDCEVDAQQWRVRSKSQPDVLHIVAVSNKGNWFCDCTAGQFRNICSHIKKAQKHYETKLKNTQNIGED